MTLVGIKKDEDFIPASGKQKDSSFRVEENAGEFTMFVCDCENVCKPLAIFSEDWKGVYK